MSPETRSLVITVSVLFISYVAFHWKYFFSQFYLDVWQTVDPRRQTILPRTGFDFLVRCVICYYAYKAYGWLQQILYLKRAVARCSAYRSASDDPARLTAAEQLQQNSSKAASAAVTEERLRQSQLAQEAERARRERAGATDGFDESRSATQDVRQEDVSNSAVAAAGATAHAAAAAVAAAESARAAATQGEADRAGGKRAWLEKLQAQQNEAAAAAAAAAKAAAEAQAAAAVAAKAEAAVGAAVAETAGTTTVSATVVVPTAAAVAADTRAATVSNTASSSSSAAAGAGTTSSTATSGVPGGGSAAASRSLKSSGNSMVSLQEAQEAEERQRQWLQQLSVNPSLSPLKVEAMEKERALKAQQDAEYEAALEVDRRRAEEAAAAEAAAEVEAAARAEAEAAAAEEEAERLRRLEELRQRLRGSLPAEPNRDDETAILVRVRLPDGCSHTRRFAAAAPVQQIRDWLQSLESFPSWEPSRWSLVNNYPRKVLGGEGDEETVSSAAHSSKQVALFVQEN